MDFTNKTRFFFLNIVLTLLIISTPTISSAESIEGYKYKGQIRISLDTIELGKFCAENGFYFNSRDLIGLYLEQSAPPSCQSTLTTVNDYAKETLNQKLKPEELELRASMRFLEIKDNKFKISFVIKKRYSTAKDKKSSSAIVEHILTGNINQLNTYRYKMTDSHDLNLQLQLYRQDNQISNIADNYSLN